MSVAHVDSTVASYVLIAGDASVTATFDGDGPGETANRVYCAPWRRMPRRTGTASGIRPRRPTEFTETSWAVVRDGLGVDARPPTSSNTAAAIPAKAVEIASFDRAGCIHAISRRGALVSAASCSPAS